MEEAHSYIKMKQRRYEDNTMLCLEYSISWRLDCSFQHSVYFALNNFFLPPLYFVLETLKAN